MTYTIIKKIYIIITPKNYYSIKNERTVFGGN